MEELSLNGAFESGIWNLIYYAEGQDHVHVEFVILPHQSDKEITKSSIKLLPYEEKVVQKLMSQKSNLRALSAIENWIKSKYSIVDVCFEKISSQYQINLCSTKDWSSVRRNPFSDLL